MSAMFSKMIGTLAVILIISAIFGTSDIISKLIKNKKKWKYSLITGILGGAFGIYGKRN